MHDAIHHSMWADVLDCWHLAANDQGFASLEAFAASEPDWDVICTISEDLIRKYLPGQDFQNLREQPASECDV